MKLESSVPSKNLYHPCSMIKRSTIKSTALICINFIQQYPLIVNYYLHARSVLEGQT